VKRHRWILLPAFALLAGCADFGAPINGSGGGGRGAAGPVPGEQENRLQAIEGRLAEVSRKVDNLNLAAQSQDVNRLETDLRSLRGELERLRYDVDANEKRSRDLYQDLDRRLQKLENESHPVRLAPESKIQSAPPVPNTQEEESAYLHTFEQLKAGRYDDAIAGFKDMTEKWPQGRYADNAWYWMGESYYVKHDYDSALKSFHTLLERFPQSPKVPDALLKVGLSQVELKKKDEAKATWQKLVKDFPGTNAAKLAQQRLDQLQ
jgi:tol-pal system protein YbgF